MDYYWHANSENDSMKYSTQCKDKHFRAREMLMDGELQYLKKLLSFQEQMFYHDINDDFKDEAPDFAQSVPSIRYMEPSTKQSSRYFLQL